MSIPRRKFLHSGLGLGISCTLPLDDGFVRNASLEQAIAQDWPVSGFHMPFPAIGRVARRGPGYDFAPIG